MVVLDGELIVWKRGRTNFALLRRRVTAGRALLRLAHDCPAHYVLFDLLADVGGEVVLGLPPGWSSCSSMPRRSSP
ncbi:hypothetical protein ACQEUX_02645 [Micromonospora sp. CA-259024]|uniref:hypothetical protein n=1 Tax=Micromonospora sp. CA-259024 TaxID=3239965 RepID=UPI003D917B2A